MYRRVVLAMGMPRSGTSWLGQILDSSPEVRYRLSPLFSYDFKNWLDPHSPREDWEKVFRGAYRSANAFMRQAERRESGLYPRFQDKPPAPPVLAIKDTRFHHLLPRALELFPALKLVCLVRHPCGAIHSWLTTAREFPSGADPAREWREGGCRKTGPGEFWGFLDWKRVTRLHRELQDRYPKRVMLLRHEKLAAAPAEETGRLFRFLELEMNPTTADFLKACHARHEDDPYAVFKRPEVVERWRLPGVGLNPRIQEAIVHDLRGGDLAEYLA